LYGSLEISTSGMIAQRARLEAYTANIANVATFTDAMGRNVPFARREVFVAPGAPGGRFGNGEKLGVRVAAIGRDSTFQPRYEPSNPLADDSGYVKYPNINPVFEQMNAYDAMRAYEANLAAAEASKAMMAQALRLIA
jgi:flagellar basal-body rod protein FlgC